MSGRYASIFALIVACAADGRGEPTAEGPRAQAPDGFWDHWGDGQAELSGYRLTQPRYGEARPGEAVLVFVTETFTEKQRVKSDGGHPDEFPVIKLNDARDFATGIYDYDVMTSTFVRLDGHDPLGLPTKVSASVSEWCGNAYEQLVLSRKGFEHVRHSYFDGEAELDEVLAVEPNGITADAWPILVRGLAGEVLAPGEAKTVPWLPTLVDGRFAHAELRWTSATLVREPSTHAITVPAGTFDVYTVTVTVGAESTTWDVETAYPHRIVRWASSDGESAELTGSFRDPYWKHNRVGDESLRERLGLEP